MSNKVNLIPFAELTKEQEISFKAIAVWLKKSGVKSIHCDTIGSYEAKDGEFRFFVMYKDDIDSLSTAVCCSKICYKKTDSFPDEKLDESYSLFEEYIELVKDKNSLNISNPDILSELKRNVKEITALIPDGENSAIIRSHNMCFNNELPHSYINKDFERDLSNNFLEDPERCKKRAEKYCGDIATLSVADGLVMAHSYPEKRLSVKVWCSENLPNNNLVNKISEDLSFEKLHDSLIMGTNVNEMLPENEEIRKCVFQKLAKVDPMLPKSLVDFCLKKLCREEKPSSKESKRNLDNRNAMASAISSNERNSNKTMGEAR